jgi:hypothetical protein
VQATAVSNFPQKLRQLGDIRRNVHNDAMSNPKPPEPPIEERIGEMIRKNHLSGALCLPSLGNVNEQRGRANR